MIAALYIDTKRGPYAGIAGVDCWGIERDATQYAGPWPVVAHPPCGQWGSLRHLALANAGESRCGPIAVAQVQRFGGVLEQPAHSRLFAHCGLPAPGAGLDGFGGFTVDVEQVAWGHPARKRTWLYCVGIERATVDAGIRRGGTVTAWVSGTYTPGKRGTVPAGIRVITPRERHLTPVAFAEWLVELARTAKV